MTRKGLNLAAYRLAILLLCMSARANTDVQFNFQNILQVANNSVTNRSFRVDPAPKEFQASGTFLIAPERITTNTFTGTIYLSNMVPMVYDCTLSLGVNGDHTFRITVPDSASLQIASQLITPTAVTTNTLSLSAARAQFVLKNDGWASNLVVTNLTLPQGAQSGYVWTATNSNGRGTWQAASGGGGGLTNLIYGTVDPAPNSIPSDPNNIFYVNTATGGLFAFGPPWAEVPYAKATVTNGLATISYVNTATNGFAKLISPDATQFSFTQESNLTAKAGILLTNVSANNITNRGTENITGTLAVGGAATFTNGITAKSTLDVASAITAASSLNADNVTVTNAFVGKSTANITGALSVGGTTTLTNQLNTQSGANITGAASVGGVLTATNTVNAQGAANITGASTHGGTATFTNGIVGQSTEQLTGALNVGGTVTASNAVNITGTSTHGGVATFTNGIVGQSTENLTGALSVGGTATFTNGVVGQSTENLTGALNVGGTGTFSNAVNITGTSTHGGTATFTNQANFQAGANITGALNVGGGYNFTNFPGATATNLPTGQTIYLDAANGSDSTAARGNAARPFLSFSNACAALQNGDTLTIRPGDYFVNTFGSPNTTLALSNGPAALIRDRTNVSIVGIGMPRIIYSNNITVLQFWNCLNPKVEGIEFNCTNEIPGTRITNLVTVIDLQGTTSGGRFINDSFLNYPDHAICTAVYEAGVGRSQSNCIVQGSYFYNGGATSGVPSLVFDGAAIVPASGWTIIGNTFDHLLRGVEYQIQGAGESIHGGVCMGNYFHGAQKECIIAASDSGADTITDLLIANNLMLDPEYVGYFVDPIHFLGGGFSRIQIRNNVIFDQNGYGGYGINFGNTGGLPSALKNNSIENNSISGMQSAGIVFDSSSTTMSLSLNNRIVGNTLISCVNGIQYCAQGGIIAKNDLSGCAFGSDNILIYNSGGGTRSNTVAGNTISATTLNPVNIQAGCSNNWIYDTVFRSCSAQLIQDANIKGHNYIGPNVNTTGIPYFGTNHLGPSMDLYSRFNQWAQNTVTNITTTTNSLVGPSIDGDGTLEGGFWTRNHMIVLNQNGSFWTGATPGNTRIIINLDTASASSNTVTQVLFAPAANQVQAGYSLEVRGVCMTNSTSGAWMFDGTLWIAGSNPLFFTNTVKVGDVTLKSIPGILVTNGASTTAFKSGTTSMRVQ